jgi:hypothetical protein
VLAERIAGNLHVAARKDIRRTVSKKQHTLKAETTKLTTREKKITGHKIKSPERSEQAHNENKERFTNRRDKSPNKSPNHEHQHQTRTELETNSLELATFNNTTTLLQKKKKNSPKNNNDNNRNFLRT